MTKLIKIGNSQGIRIPKEFIKTANLDDKNIEFVLVDNGLLLRPVGVRQGWDEMFKNAKGNDQELDGWLDIGLSDEAF